MIHILIRGRGARAVGNRVPHRAVPVGLLFAWVGGRGGGRVGGWGGGGCLTMAFMPGMILRRAGRGHAGSEGRADRGGEEFHAFWAGATVTT